MDTALQEEINYLVVITLDRGKLETLTSSYHDLINNGRL